jgi:hypoxanthine phosphoribosyltransferase
MKRYLNQETMKSMIQAKAGEFSPTMFDEVVAVSRGGVSIGHIFAKAMKLQMGFLFPKKREIAFFNEERDIKAILIVEDLVAQGRTSKIIHDMMAEKYSHINYYYLPFLVDADYKDTDYDDCCMIGSDWIVFPWEDMDAMQEGDRGLFRDGTDVYNVYREITERK